MNKVRNIKTGVIKELKSEVETSMYLATGEWELVVPEKKEVILSKSKENK